MQRDNDGSVELKKTSQETLQEKDEIIQKLQEELEENQKENAILRENVSTFEEKISEMKNAFDTKIAEQEQRILELSLNGGPQPAGASVSDVSSHSISHKKRPVHQHVDTSFFRDKDPKPSIVSLH